MTKEQIFEGERKCLIFMGVEPKFESWTGKFSWKDSIFFATSCATYTEAMDDIVKYAKYDSDWNWLMGVVGKIGEVCQALDDDESDRFFDSDEWIGIEDSLPHACILDVFTCVVDFIDFYNDKNSH